MEVKVWGYLKEYAENKEEILKAVEEVFESGQLILGNKVQLFEKTYAAYCGVNYGIGVDNGTNAITLALHSLGITRGRSDYCCKYCHTNCFSYCDCWCNSCFCGY